MNGEDALGRATDRRHAGWTLKEILQGQPLGHPAVGTLSYTRDQLERNAWEVKLAMGGS
jgi:hypothetical protein